MTEAELPTQIPSAHVTGHSARCWLEKQLGNPYRYLFLLVCATGTTLVALNVEFSLLLELLLGTASQSLSFIWLVQLLERD